jgi:hypothetical protein
MATTGYKTRLKNRSVYKKNKNKEKREKKEKRTANHFEMSQSTFEFFSPRCLGEFFSEKNSKT